MVAENEVRPLPLAPARVESGIVTVAAASATTASAIVMVLDTVARLVGICGFIATMLELGAAG